MKYANITRLTLSSKVREVFNSKRESKPLFGLLTLTLLLQLTACGGGGGSDSAPAVQVTPPATTPPTTTPPTTVTPPIPPTPPVVEPVPDPTSLDDLIVDPDFDLQAAFTLSINVDIASGKRGYFSLCDKFEQQGQTISVNYESCLLRGALDNGQLSESLLVANHQRDLMAVVWFYDGNQPQYLHWQYAANEVEQQLVIN
ncbi:hypothetical protein ACRWQM_15830 [Shewanella sp. HL-SH5]|uniref:hypothetical protein n=1 Tax=Shewanella sp. HL-SH5 TaxID=3436241 RepID=UPI003EB723DA